MDKRIELENESVIEMFRRQDIEFVERIEEINEQGDDNAKT